MGAICPHWKKKEDELDLEPINRYIPPETDGGKLPPSEEAETKKLKKKRTKKLKKRKRIKKPGEIKMRQVAPIGKKIQRRRILDETSEFLEEQEKIFLLFFKTRKNRKRDTA